MRRILSTGGLGLLVVWGALTGCQRAVVREKALPDPLLTSKKPVEGKPHMMAPESIVREVVPAPPPMPAEVRQCSEDRPIVQLLGPPR